MKQCTKCKNIKSLSDFNKNKTTVDGLGSYCKLCEREQCKKYYRNLSPERKMERRLMRQGVSLEEYYELLQKQNGRCAICNCKESQNVNQGVLCLDHSHYSEKIRGLLCHDCNLILGYIERFVRRTDMPLTELAKRVFEYLENNDESYDYCRSTGS